MSYAVIIKDKLSNSFLLSSVRHSLLLVISLSLLGIVLWRVGFVTTLSQFKHFSLKELSILFLLLFLNLAVVTFRFWRVLLHLGTQMPWALAVRASVIGNVAGLFFIPLFGQVAGRQIILKNEGLSPVTNASVAAYERILLAVTGGGLAIWGSFFLSGHELLNQFIGKFQLLQILFILGIGVFLSFFIGRGDFETNLLRRLFSRKNALRFLEIATVTFLGQFLMLLCFVQAFHVIAPQISFTSLFAAAAVVCFAASLPISVGGWGIRELAAIYVLGLLGVSAANAILASVVVGVCSTVVILAAAPFVWNQKSSNRLEAVKLDLSAPTPISLEQASAWLLSLATAALVFFQMEFSLSKGTINLNLADPFALLAFVTLVMHCFFSRELPRWKIKNFNFQILLFSIMLLVGFFIGIRHIGITAWALNGRLLGWIVLLGYLAAGYLMVFYHSLEGFRRLLETMISIVASIVIFKAILAMAITWGGGFMPDHGNFDGYAGNRNAFSFQLLSISALTFGLSNLLSKPRELISSSKIIIFLQSILFFGVFLTASRAGIAATAALLLVAGLSGLVSRRFIFWSMSGGVLLWLSMLLFSHLLSSTFGHPNFHVQASISKELSDRVRWMADFEAVKMWLKAPFFGAGLGVFFANSTQKFGFPMVIHSTPLWILAEFGLFGITIFTWIGFTLLRYCIKLNPLPFMSRCLLLLLIVFLVMCQLHEILYQRIFWLLLGGLLAWPSNEISESEGLA